MICAFCINPDHRLDQRLRYVLLLPLPSSSFCCLLYQARAIFTFRLSNGDLLEKVSVINRDCVTDDFFFFVSSGGQIIMHLRNSFFLHFFAPVFLLSARKRPQAEAYIYPVPFINKIIFIFHHNRDRKT